MSEQRAPYLTECKQSLLKPDSNSVTLTTELDTVRTQLVNLECQLLSALVTVQRALGKEPSVMTRRDRRGR